jgi:hypothetical protein
MDKIVMDKVIVNSSQVISYNNSKENNQNTSNKEIKYEIKNFRNSRNNYIRKIFTLGILIYSFSKALGKYE